MTFSSFARSAIALGGATYKELISVSNLCEAWRKFIKGKRARRDVQMFERQFAQHIVHLHERLTRQTYTHSGYEAFTVHDPKTRRIHKASVEDRVLHTVIYHLLYPVFDRTFIFDSYSCRVNKGTHRALDRFHEMGRKVSRNNHEAVWVLKCDIRKFFASIEHRALLAILDDRIGDKEIVGLLESVIMSFHSGIQGIGLPLGNLTSQLFSNIYMNVFDQFVKHELKAKYYIRYADDFIFLSKDKGELQRWLNRIDEFLWDRLRLRLHPDKVFIKTLASGVDFLGWIHFPHHRVLRKATKRRFIKKIQVGVSEAAIQSYRGVMGHGDTYHLEQTIFPQKKNSSRV